jgi:hypothetical protein
MSTRLPVAAHPPSPQGLSLAGGETSREGVDPLVRTRRSSRALTLTPLGHAYLACVALAESWTPEQRDALRAARLGVRAL